MCLVPYQIQACPLYSICKGCFLNYVDCPFMEDADSVQRSPLFSLLVEARRLFALVLGEVVANESRQLLRHSASTSKFIIFKDSALNLKLKKLLTSTWNVV